ncbi:MAG: hypothetical protein GF353_18325 [Candidatus Lokiarchaeota archaeon]|nr:hypothetical protein [Candidatus Lokiarchaeota archaeon]
MEIIKYLGERMAQKIEISPPAARGLLKLAIKDEMGPFTPLNQVNFNDLKKVIQNSLFNRLDGLKVNNLKEIVKDLLEELTQNQSLITIAGV